MSVDVDDNTCRLREDAFDSVHRSLCAVYVFALSLAYPTRMLVFVV